MLTIEDLESVREAHQKVQRCRRLLREAAEAGTPHSVNYDRIGTPTNYKGSSTEKNVVRKLERERALRTAQLEKVKAELLLMLKIGGTVKDARLRLILQYRYVNLMSWERVSAELGGRKRDSIDAVKQAHKRFIDELKQGSDAEN